MKLAYRFHDLETGRMAEAADAVDATMALTSLTTAVATAMIAAMTTTGLYMSIHTASPANTGANEIVGNTGYTGTRPAISWSAFATDHQTSGGANAVQTFPMLVLESGGIPYFGIWTAATAGTFITGGPTSGLSGSIPIGANVTFTSAVTLTVAG